MICEKCGSELSGESKFCTNCGNEMRVIQCTSCKEWINKKYTYCPMCGSRRNSIDTSSDESEHVEIQYDRNQIISMVTNGIIILLTLVMVTLLFTRVSTFNFNENLFRRQVYVEEYRELPLNIIDYGSSSLKGLSDYTSQDFQEEEFRQIRYAGQIIDINFLKSYMLDDMDDNSVLQRSIIYIDTLLLITMAVVPLILMGYSINDFVKYKRSNRHRTFFLSTLILGFILMISIELMGLDVGYGTILYISLSVIGIMADYIIQLIERKRTFRPRQLIASVITLIGLFALLLMSSNAIIDSELTTMNIKVGADYGDLAYIANEVKESDIGFEFMFVKPIVVHLTNTDVRETHEWIMYVALLIPVTMLITIGFLVSSFISVINKETSVENKRSRSIMYIWGAFAFEVVTFILALVVATGFDNYLKIASHDHRSFYDINEVELTIANGFMFFMCLTLAMAVYKTIVEKRTTF